MFKLTVAINSHQKIAASDENRYCDASHSAGITILVGKKKPTDSIYTSVHEILIYDFTSARSLNVQSFFEVKSFLYSCDGFDSVDASE